MGRSCKGALTDEEYHAINCILERHGMRVVCNAIADMLDTFAGLGTELPDVGGDDLRTAANNLREGMY